LRGLVVDPRAAMQHTWSAAVGAKCLHRRGSREPGTHADVDDAKAGPAGGAARALAGFVQERGRRGQWVVGDTTAVVWGRRSVRELG